MMDGNPNELAADVPPRPQVNMPVPYPSYAKLNGEEPPPLPPATSGDWQSLFNGLGGQPRAMPFWWHQTTRAQEIAYWSRAFDGVQVSSLDFYDAFEKSLTDHGIRQLRLSRVLWKEGGLLSAQRLYSRVTWNRYVGDVCAAPFGKTFFFSFWVFVLPPVLSIWHIAGIMATFVVSGLALGFFAPFFFHDALPLFFLPMIPLMATWIRYSRQAVNEEPMADFLLGLTLIGPIIDLIFRPLSYFQRDTAGMFLALMEKVFFERIDEMTTGTSLRPLTDLEKKPAMVDMLNMKRMGRK